MSAVEILRQARELIADKSRWTQKTFARRTGGSGVHSKDNDAICWCAKGAVAKTSSSFEEFCNALDILDGVSLDLYGNHVVAINDDDTDVDSSHRRVLRVYDEAIKRIEAANA